MNDNIMSRAEIKQAFSKECITKDFGKNPDDAWLNEYKPRINPYEDDITTEDLRLIMELRDGHFYRKVSQGCKKAGTIAGKINKLGEWIYYIQKIKYTKADLLEIYFYKGDK